MATYKQDMPPRGGYAPITYHRIPLKGGMNLYLKAAGAVAIMGLGWVGFTYAKTKHSNERIEMRCGTLALMPLLHAENDRMMLKQLKKNRDDEEKIMKDVEGWEVGKWKGLRTFMTIGEDEYFSPGVYDYYLHTDPKHLELIYYLNQRT